MRAFILWTVISLLLIELCIMQTTNNTTHSSTTRQYQLSTTDTNLTDNTTIDVSTEETDNSTQNITSITTTDENITTITTETTKSTEPTTTTEPPIPNFDPPNYRYKVLKSNEDDYWTPICFYAIGFLVIILTVFLHYYLEGIEKQRQNVMGSRYIPEKKRKTPTANTSEVTPQ